MAISPGTWLAIFTFVVSLLILLVGGWNLYLSHYQEGRSEIKLQSEDSGSPPAFEGGNHAIDQSAFWMGSFYLKIVNSGNKGAYIASDTHSLEGLKKGDQTFDPENVTLEIRNSTRSWAGTEIDPRSSKRYRVSTKISTETDLGVLVNHDSAIIRHTLEIEDNKGSYEVAHNTEMRLVGPEAAIENWEENQNTQD